MAYQLKLGRPVTEESRRIIEKQLQAAAQALRPARPNASARAIHAARRRVKKSLAAMYLIRPALASAPRAWIRAIRDVSRSLAPVADGEAVIETLGRVAARDASLTPTMVSAVRRRLVRFERWLERSAQMRYACHTSARVLSDLAAEPREWRFRKTGFRAIASGLKRSFRKARKAMMTASRQPSTRTYHRWRQRSKDHWLHLRLLEARCHGRIADSRQLVEELDECLGEHHNVALLAELFATRPLASREDTVIWLKALRSYRTELRLRARGIGQRIYGERPRQLVARLRGAWRAPAAQKPTASGERAGWPRVA